MGRKAHLAGPLAVLAVVLLVSAAVCEGMFTYTQVSTHSTTKNPTTCRSQQRYSGEEPWTNPQNAAGAPDGVYATFDNLCGKDKSEMLVCGGYGFDFQGLEQYVSLRGLRMRFRTWHTSSGDADDEDRRHLINGALLGDDEQDGTNWDNFGSPGWTYYRGGTSDMWSLSLTPYDVNDPGYEFVVRADEKCESSGQSVGIDTFELEWTYTLSLPIGVGAASSRALPGSLVTITGQFLDQAPDLRCHFTTDSGSTKTAAEYVAPDGSYMTCRVPGDTPVSSWAQIDVATNNNADFVDGTLSTYIPSIVDAAKMITGILPTTAPARSGFNGFSPSFSLNGVGSGVTAIDGFLDGTAFVALIATGGTCSSGPLVSRTVLAASSAANLQFNPVVDTAGVYDLCFSGYGDTVSNYRKVAGATVTFFDAAATDVLSVSPTVVGASTSFSLQANIEPTRLFVVSQATKIGLGAGDSCAAPIAIKSYTSLSDTLTYSASDVTSPGDYAVCLSVFPDAWVKQTGVTLAVRDGSLASVSPAVFGTGSLPVLDFVGGVYTATGTRFGFVASPSGVCSPGNVVSVVPYLGTPVPLATALAAGTFKVCGSVDGGASYIESGPTVTVTNDINVLTSVTPTDLVAGVASSMTFTGVDPSSTTSILLVTSSSNCLTPTLTLDATTSTSGLSVTLSAGTYYTCVQTGVTPRHQGVAGQITVVDPTDKGSAQLTAAITVANGGQTTPVFTVTDVTAFPSAHVALAFPGGCGAPSLRVDFPVSSLTAGSLGLTTITVPGTWPVSPPSVTLDTCFSWDGTVFVQQGGPTMTVLFSTPTVVTSFVPASVVNSSSPAFQIEGPMVSDLTFIGLAPPGTCDTPGGFYGAPVAFSSATRVVQFSQIIVQETNVLLALCVSVDGGSTFEDQVVASAIPVVNDPNALVIGNVAELVLVAGVAPTSVTLVAGTTSLTSPSTVAFTRTSCIAEQLSPTVVTGLGSTTLSAPFANAGVMALCLSSDSGGGYPASSFIQQIGLGTKVYVVPASSGQFISDVSPSSWGIGYAASVTLTRGPGTVAVGCPTCMVAFSLNPTCLSGIQGATSLSPALDSLTVTLATAVSGSAGTYTVCYSTNSGSSYTAQSLTTVELETADAGDISAVTPPLFASTMTVDLAVETPLVSAGSRVGITLAADCSSPGSFTSSIVYDSASPTWTVSSLAVGVYTVCYSVDGGANYVVAAASLEVIEATPTSMTDFAARVIGAATHPTMTFSGVRVSPNSAVAFVPVALSGQCGSPALREGTTVLDATLSPVLGTAFTLGTTTHYRVCYTVTLGLGGIETWVEQTALPADLRVVVADSLSLTSLSPPLLAVSFAETVTLGGLTATPTTKFGFTTTGSCAAGLDGVTSYTNSSLGGTVQLATGLPTTGSVRVCYTVDDGASWHLQGPSLEASVVAALPTALTSYAPVRTGASYATPQFVFDGAVLTTTNAKIGFSTDAGCATVDSEMDVSDWSGPGSTQAYDWASALAPSVATAYTVCYTVDGVNYVAQSGVADLWVEVATSTSLGTLTPSNWGVGATGFGVTYSGGSKPTPVSYIGLLAGAGPCGTGPFDALMHFAPGVDAVSDTEFNAANPVTGPGTYTVCLSVTGPSGPFVAQTGPVTGVAVASGDLVSLTPSSWLSYVPETLTLSFTGGFAATPTTTLGFVYTGSSAPVGGECAGASSLGDVYGATLLTGVTSQPLTTGLPLLGNYTACLTVNGATWVEATSAPTGVEIVGASATQISGLSTTTVDSGVTTEVVFYGARLTGLTQVGLANLGFSSGSSDRRAASNAAAQAGCDNTGALLEVTTLSTINAVNVTLVADGEHAVCYSENGGLTYMAQTNPGTRLTVQECSQYTSCGSCRSTPTCAWCLADNTCTSEASSCSTQAVCPTCTSEQTTCPTLFELPTSPAIGAYTGGSTLRLGSSYAAAPVATNTTRPQMTCEFFVPETLRRTRTNATVESTGVIACEAPPSELGLVNAQVQVFVDSELYTAPGQVVDFTYYVCEDVAVCSGCHDTAARPDCGYCLESQTCSTGAVCAAPSTWAGTECPAVTGVSPADGLVTGGSLLTVTGSLFVDVEGMEVVFGSDAVRVNATYVSPTTYTVVSPRVPAAGQVVLSLARGGLEYAQGSTAVFNYLGDPALIPREPPSNSPVIIGSAVGAVLFVLVVVALILGLMYQRRRAREALLRPPVLTDEVREKIMFGAAKTLSAEDRKLVGLLQSFTDAIVMDHEIIATIGDVTQATEMDKVTRAVNAVYESRGLSLRMLLYMVSREVSLALTQSTLFRTNSFATKLFKTFSKMKGLDYLHYVVARQVNMMLLDGVGDVDALKKKGSGNSALERFALLERCQKVFKTILDSEDRVPPEFRFLFEHVRRRMQTKFPVSSDDLGLYIADSLRDHLDETSEAYIEGNNCFTDLAALAPHIQSDMNVLGSIIGPVQENLSNFEATITSLTSQLKKVNGVVDQLRGALDPNSEAATRFLEEHQRVQNSIAVGGFMFLRFLVPALTAPEAFHMVHELPTPDERKLLVMIGKVLQNLSNGKEFGSKEKHMVQMNDFILENQAAVAKLFDKLSTVAPGSTAIESLGRLDIPKRYLEDAVVTLWKHAKVNRAKIVARLQERTFGGKQLPPEIVSQREQAAKVFALVLDQTQQFIDAGGSGPSDYLVNGIAAGPPPRLQSMIQFTDEVFDALMQAPSVAAPAADASAGAGADAGAGTASAVAVAGVGDAVEEDFADDGAGAGVALNTLTLTPIVPQLDSSDSSSAGLDDSSDGPPAGGVVVLDDAEPVAAAEPVTVPAADAALLE